MGAQPATVARINEIIAWLNGFTVADVPANYETAVTFASTWFQNTSANVPYRAWVFVTSGFGADATISAAQKIVAPLVNFQGSDEVGFVPVDIYPVTVGIRDTRNVRFLHNTPHFPIDTLEALNSTVLTDRVDAVRRGELLFQSVPISMDPIKANGSPGEKVELKIKVAKDNPIALYYRDQIAQTRMLLTIHEGQADDPDQQFVLVWTGRVLSSRRLILENEVELTAVPMTSAFKRSGLQRNYQYGCNNVLYGDRCKASLAAATSSFDPAVALFSPTSRILTVPSGFFSVRPASRYIAGLCWWQEGKTTIRRNIVRVDGLNLLLDGPIGQAYAAPRIYLAYGCPHTPDFCRTVHINSETGSTNIVNYGGADLIPTTSPFRFVSSYY